MTNPLEGVLRSMGPPCITDDDLRRIDRLLRMGGASFTTSGTRTEWKRQELSDEHRPDRIGQHLIEFGLTPAIPVTYRPSPDVEFTRGVLQTIGLSTNGAHGLVHQRRAEGDPPFETVTIPLAWITHVEQAI